jgi:Lar family restriction alleviation protein
MGLVETKAPERIYLQDGCDDPDCMEGLANGAYQGVTWCTDRIHDNDTQYVRADIHAAEIERLTAALAHAQHQEQMLGIDCSEWQSTAEQFQRQLAESIPMLGGTYVTQEGKHVTMVRIHGIGTPYETLEDEYGVNRYSRRLADMGRVTGTAHDYSDPFNLQRPIRAIALREAALQSHSSGASSVSRGPSVGTDAAAPRQLLPCPFCGKGDVCLLEPQAEDDGFPYVECGWCGARGPCVKLKSVEAIAEWNTRTSAPGQDTTLQNASGTSERRKALEEAALTQCELCREYPGTAFRAKSGHWGHKIPDGERDPYYLSCRAGAIRALAQQGD